MSAQQRFFEACRDGDVNEVMEAMQDPEVQINGPYGDYAGEEKMLHPSLFAMGPVQNAGLRIAVENGNMEIVKMLVEDDRSSLEDGIDVVIRAAQYGKWEVVEYLLEHPKFSSPKWLHVVFYLSIKHGYVRVVKFLLDKGMVRPRWEDLHTALSAKETPGKQMIVEMLQDDPDVLASAEKQRIKDEQIKNGTWDDHIKIEDSTRGEIMDL